MTDINKETISILNDLIETSIDGKEGFQTSAENAKTPSVKTFFHTPFCGSRRSSY